MGSCAAPSAKGDDKFITTDYLQQCRFLLASKSLFHEEFRLLLTHCNIIYNHLSIIFDKSLISSLLQ
ncbi:hypothetical protein CKJ89_32485 [Klebsiella pneumoniae]|nr:hypothetical protein CKJ89_32485 [Klebsiella pneumoniae]